MGGRRWINWPRKSPVIPGVTPLTRFVLGVDGPFGRMEMTNAMDPKKATLLFNFTTLLNMGRNPFDALAEANGNLVEPFGSPDDAAEEG